MKKEMAQAIDRATQEILEAQRPQERDFKFFVKMKRVQAGRITEILPVPSPTEESNVTDLLFEHEGKRLTVTHAWMELNKPEVGGYYVLFVDGSSCYMAEREFQFNYVG